MNMAALHVLLGDETQTYDSGVGLARCRPDQATLYLEGDLGAGKTTFSRGFIQACGHQGAVKSPTYTLVETYLLPEVQINHLDLYRLMDAEELHYLGLDDMVQAGVINLIEWPERGAQQLADADMTVRLNHCPEGRELVFSPHNSAAAQWLAAYHSHLPKRAQIKD